MDLLKLLKTKIRNLKHTDGQCNVAITNDVNCSLARGILLRLKFQELSELTVLRYLLLCQVIVLTSSTTADHKMKHRPLSDIVFTQFLTIIKYHSIEQQSLLQRSL